MNLSDDIALEISRTYRECLARVEEKIRAGQNGELFEGLELPEAKESPNEAVSRH